MSDAAAQVVELTVGDKDLAVLRNDDTLSGKLLLNADGATVSANAHCAGLVETDERILRRVAYRKGLGLNLRSVDGESGLLAFDVRVNNAAV